MSKRKTVTLTARTVRSLDIAFEGIVQWALDHSSECECERSEKRRVERQIAKADDIILRMKRVLEGLED